MTRKTKKSAAQLDREIREALAGPRSSRTKVLHHSTKVAQLHHADQGAGDWDVAMDALLEQDAVQAAKAGKIVKSLKRDHGIQTMTPAFVEAFSTAPKAVREVFERVSGLVSQQSYDWSAFAKGATKGFWEMEVAGSHLTAAGEKKLKAKSASPEAKRVAKAARSLAKRFAEATRGKLTLVELNEIADKLSSEQAGYLGAMQASIGDAESPADHEWFDKGVDVDPPLGDQQGQFNEDEDLREAIEDAIVTLGLEWEEEQ